ncbi:MAG: conjugal transfer protein TraF [Acidobacteriota bacterium]
MPRARLVVVLLLLSPGTAGSDSTFPILGARATGLGGAFTAVADDVTAFHWNPAGVAYGPYARMGFFTGAAFQDRGELVNRLRSGDPGEGSELVGDGAFGFSAGLTFLGLAVTRFTHTRSILDGELLRSDGLQTVDLVVSFVQSLPPDELTVGVNFHHIRGKTFRKAESAADIPQGERNVRDLVHRATAAEGKAENELDLDVGVLYQPAGWIRAGLTVRHLARPAFHFESEEEDPLVLGRHARAGVALMLPRSFLVALDADVTRQETRSVGGLGYGWREVVLGAEKSWRHRMLTLGGGFRMELGGGEGQRAGFSAAVGLVLKGVRVDVGATSSTRRKQGAYWFGVTLSR